MKAGRKVPLKKYYLRRLTRLEPPYILNMIILFGLIIMVKGKTAAELFPNLMASLSYTHLIFFKDASIINGVAWSLEVEIRFYILAPLLCQVFRIKPDLPRRGLLICLIAAGTTLQFADVSEMAFLYNAHYFLVGFLLADVYLVNWERTPGKSRSWDLLAAPFWACIFFQAYIQSEYNHLMLPFVILIAYMGAFRGKIINRIAGNSWMITIGGMCYTLYLYHYAIISALGRITIHLPRSGIYSLDLPAQTALILPVILVICSLLFAFAEKPFMRRTWPREAWAFVKGLGKPGAP